MTQPVHTGTWFRANERMVLAYYLAAIPRFIAWIGLGLAWTQRTDQPLVPILAATSAVLIEILVPLYEWLFTWYRIAASGIEQRSGLIKRRTLRISWQAVRSVDSSQSWAERTTGTYTISLKQESELEGHIKVVGATPAVKSAIENSLPTLLGHDVERSAEAYAGDPSLSAQGDSQAPESVRHPKMPPNSEVPIPTPCEPALGDDEPAVREGAPSGRVLFQARLSHVITGAFCSGTVVLVAPSALLAVLDVVDDSPFGDALVGGLLAMPLPLAITVVVVIGVAAGLGVTVLRFHRLRVIDTSEAVEVTYGWPGRTRRTIPRAALTGMIWTANPLEQVIGWRKLRFLTPESGASGTRPAALPALPNSVIAQILRTATHTVLRRASDSPALPEGSGSSLTGLSVALAGLGLRILSLICGVSTGWQLTRMGSPLWIGVAVGALLFWLMGALVRLLSSGFTYEGGLLVHRSSLPGIRVTYQEISAIHGFSRWQLFSNTTPALLVTATSFTGRRLKLRSMRTDLSWLEPAERDSVHASSSNGQAPPSTVSVATGRALETCPPPKEKQ